MSDQYSGSDAEQQAMHMYAAFTAWYSDTASAGLTIKNRAYNAYVAGFMKQGVINDGTVKKLTEKLLDCELLVRTYKEIVDKMHSKPSIDNTFNLEQALKNQAETGDPKVETTAGYKILHIARFKNAKTLYPLYVEIKTPKDVYVTSYKIDGTREDLDSLCMTLPEPKLSYINFYADTIKLGHARQFTAVVYPSKETADSKSNIFAGEQRLNNRCYELDLS